MIMFTNKEDIGEVGAMFGNFCKFLSPPGVSTFTVLQY